MAMMTYGYCRTGKVKSTTVAKLIDFSYVRVLVMYDESDSWFCRKVLIPNLQQRRILCYTLEDNGYANTSKLENLCNLLQQCNKVLFVLSQGFQRTPININLAKLIFSTVSSENLVCFLTETNVVPEDKLWWIKTTRLVQANSDDELIQELLQKPIPNFSHYLCSTVSDSSFCRGLDLLHLYIDIYGIVIEMKNNVLRIDADEYIKHATEHHNYDTTRVCGECSSLCTPDTTVSLIIKEKVTNEVKNKLENVVSELCTKVLNFAPLRQSKKTFSLGCTLSGKLIDGMFMRELWLTILYKGFSEKANGDSIKYPDYVTVQSRYESFPDTWASGKVPKAEDLAEAGFFFSDSPYVTKCFMCGWTLMNWREDDEAWHAHAAINAACPYVQDNLTYEDIRYAQTSYIRGKYKADDKYSTVESRRQTFVNCSNEMSLEIIDELVDAGFYYTGIQDFFACFSCGIMLTNLKPGSSIMAVHTRLSPACSRVHEMGPAYVKGILDTVEDGGPTVLSYSLKKAGSEIDSRHTNMFLYIAVNGQSDKHADQHREPDGL